MIQLILWEVCSLALVYSCFCRASFTSKANTKRDIRWAFTILGMVAWVCLFAPWWGYDPDGISIMLLFSMTAVQLTTAYHWRAGVPEQFRRRP